MISSRLSWIVILDTPISTRVRSDTRYPPGPLAASSSQSRISRPFRAARTRPSISGADTRAIVPAAWTRTAWPSSRTGMRREGGSEDSRGDHLGVLNSAKKFRSHLLHLGGMNPPAFGVGPHPGLLPIDSPGANEVGEAGLRRAGRRPRGADGRVPASSSLRRFCRKPDDPRAHPRGAQEERYRRLLHLVAALHALERKRCCDPIFSREPSKESLMS